MCRVFGFRSVIESQVHSSLVHADNALLNLSEDHPDGWGVAYYMAGAPHIIKSCSAAFADKLFQRVSGVVSSETVIAHIRNATAGTKSIINTHPFQYGRWSFAHNGNIKDFESHRDELRSRIAPMLRRYILGDTDSELLFFLILTHVSRRVELNKGHCSIDELATSTADALTEIQNIVGEFSHDADGPPTDTYFTFIITDGHVMLGHQGGKELNVSTYKKLCMEKDDCPHYAHECENPTKSGQVSHLIFSSEPLDGQNVWRKMKPGEMFGVDWRMRLWSNAEETASEKRKGLKVLR